MTWTVTYLNSFLQVENDILLTDICWKYWHKLRKPPESNHRPAEDLSWGKKDATSLSASLVQREQPFALPAVPANQKWNRNWSQGKATIANSIHLFIILCSVPTADFHSHLWFLLKHPEFVFERQNDFSNCLANCILSWSVPILKQVLDLLDYDNTKKTLYLSLYLYIFRCFKC